MTRHLLAVACAASILSLLPGGGRGEAKGKKYALLIGVNAYSAAGFGNLNYAENDAEEMAKVLRGKEAGFDSVVVLTTKRGKSRASDGPTTANISAAIKRLLAGKSKKDTLLIGLAGHGVQLKLKGTTKDESFFCPANAQLNDQSTLISLTRLFRDLDACGAGTKLLLVDACRNTPPGTRSLGLNLLPRPGSGIAALFSCKSGECACEVGSLGKGHGVFFYYVIEGLKGKAKDRKGKVTWNGLVEYVTDQVTDEAPKRLGEEIKQTPQEVRNMQGKSPCLCLIKAAEVSKIARPTATTSNALVKDPRPNAPAAPLPSTATTADVEFPGKPKESSASGKSQLVLEAMGGKAAYLLMVNVMPVKIDITNKAAIKKILDGGRDGGVKGLKGKLVSEKDITMGKYPGRTFDIQTATGLYRSRVYLTEGKMFQVVVFGPKEFSDGADAKKFLESLKINE